jgi:hypothetical protein
MDMTVKSRTRARAVPYSSFLLNWSIAVGLETDRRAVLNAVMIAQKVEQTVAIGA